MDYIDVADVAKMIRPLLKRAFPETKFSVRISRYSGGCSIAVHWVDGPISNAVEDIVHGFGSKYFEGMDDSSHWVTSWYCPDHGARHAESPQTVRQEGCLFPACCDKADIVRFACDYVNVYRAISREFEDGVRLLVRTRANMDTTVGAEGDGDEFVASAEYVRFGYDTVRHAIRREASRLPAYVTSALQEGAR